jgi:hypothetical protein
MIAFLLASASCAALTACGSVPVRVRPGPALDAQAVAVYPCNFRYDEPAYRSYEVSQALALQAVATKRYAVFGPGEFKLVRNSSDNPFVGSDIALQLADRGLSAVAALVFKPTLERRAQSAVKQLYDEQGRPRGSARVEEATLVARLEVFHSASREVIADTTGQVDVDPLTPRDAIDPLPEATALLQKMMTRVLDAIAERAPGKKVDRASGFEFLWNPKAALDFSFEGKPALSEALGKLDALEQDVALEARLRFFHPKAAEPLVGKLGRLPAGLYVTTVTEAATASGLQIGDLVLAVNDEQASPQSLQRALRAGLPGQPIALKVKRSSGLVDLYLAVP